MVDKARNTKDPALTRVFKACDETLRAAYAGSSLTSQNQATTRTCANRETLVRDLLDRMLPVATRTLHGAVLVDSHGGESGDVDVAVIAPWGAPVWPFQAHPLVPCEGVIAGVFCEVSNPRPQGDVWRQVSRARGLFKSVAREDDDAAGSVPRGLTPNLGLWCWGDGVGPAQLKKILDEAHDAQRNEELIARAKRTHSSDDSAAYAARVLAVGAHAPNWFYWHGHTRENAQFAFRVHRKVGGDWNAPNVMPGFSADPSSETSAWSARDGHPFEWKYIVVPGTAEEPRALEALIAYLSTQVVLYGNEMPHYGSYVRQTP